MAEPGRNLPPTRKKLQDARKKGEVARYRDFVCFFSLAAGWASLLWLLPQQAKKILSFTAEVMASSGGMDAGAAAAGDLMPWISSAGKVLLALTMAVALPVFFLTLAAGLFSTRFVFSLKPVTARMSRLNPLEGAKKVFSSERWFGLLKDLLKIGFLAVGGVLIIEAALEILPQFVHARTPEAGKELLLNLIQTIFLYSFFALIPIILIDVIYSRHAYRKKMMMTHEELKREMRETEGDPWTKGRRQRLHREIVQQRMLQDVKRATVVVVNPDHIAIALLWEEEAMDAPTVVATGREHMAGKIIAEARRSGVPVIRDFRIARNLAELQVGEEIPENLYEAVANIIRILSD